MTEDDVMRKKILKFDVGMQYAVGSKCNKSIRMGRKDGALDEYKVKNKQ